MRKWIDHSWTAIVLIIELRSNRYVYIYIYRFVLNKISVIPLEYRNISLNSLVIHLKHFDGNINLYRDVKKLNKKMWRMMCRKRNYWPNKILFLFLLSFLRSILFCSISIYVLGKLFMSHSKQKKDVVVVFNLVFKAIFGQCKDKIRYVCKPKKYATQNLFFSHNKNV